MAAQHKMDSGSDIDYILAAKLPDESKRDELDRLAKQPAVSCLCHSLILVVDIPVIFYVSAAASCLIFAQL